MYQIIKEVGVATRRKILNAGIPGALSDQQLRAVRSCVAQARAGVRIQVTRVARDLGVRKAWAHGLLTELVLGGYLLHPEYSLYSLTPKGWAAGEVDLVGEVLRLYQGAGPRDKAIIRERIASS